MDKQEKIILLSFIYGIIFSYIFGSMIGNNDFGIACALFAPASVYGLGIIYSIWKELMKEERYIDDSRGSLTLGIFIILISLFVFYYIGYVSLV